MGDLILAICLMTGLCATMALIGLKIGSRLSPSGRLWIVLAGVSWIVVFSHWFFDTVSILYLLPLTAVAIYGNWVAPAGSFIAGVLWRHQAIPKWRRAVLLIALAIFAFKDLPTPVLVLTPLCDDLWEGDVPADQRFNMQCCRRRNASEAL